MKELSFERVLLGGVALLLAFVLVWATVTGDSSVAISAIAGLIIIGALVVVWPESFDFEGGGLKASMRRRAEQQRTKVVETAQRLIEMTVTDPTGLTDQASASAEAQRELEEVITESAEWGFMMAQAGFQTVPRPHVQWIDGEPRIMFATGDPSGPRGGRLTGTERPGYDRPGDEPRLPQGQ